VRADPARRAEVLALPRLLAEPVAAFGVAAFGLVGRLRAGEEPPGCARRVDGRLAGAALTLAPLPLSVLVSLLDVRAAALRGLVRPGRVRGRFARTLSRSPAVSGRPSLWFGPLMRTSLLNAGPRRLQKIHVPSDS
jgi:hypothetical protein